MKQIRRGLALVLALAMLFALTLSAFAAADVQSQLQKTASYTVSAVQSPGVGSVGGEWTIIGLARAEYAVPASYYADYYARVEKTVKESKGVLHARKYTEYSRVILALTAIGKDPANVAGYNLLQPLGDFEQTVWQGVNGAMWALIALDAGNYTIPKNPDAATQATRQMYVDEILKQQLPDGGWNLTGSGEADADLTAMALQALSKYQDQKAVKTASDKALSCLSALQLSSGGFASWGEENAESSAQVILALGALGISLDDSRFVKNKHTCLDALLAFSLKDGSFSHTAKGESNLTATEQALCALASASRQASGKSSLYTMTDNSWSASGSVKKGEKDPSVSVPAVTSPGTTFSDIRNNENRAAIEALASRGIINGISKTSFQPDKTMTRAEFAAIVTRALGLPEKKTASFTDVSSGAWYAGYIGAANSAGIVNGVGGGKFNPGGTITRQEAAAMVVRAAKLCGLDTAMTEQEISHEMVQFGDYRAVSSWARAPLAYCYSAGILDRGEKIQPTQAIVRGEIAQMLYRMLTIAELI